jgi:hypothetical protein
MKFSFSNLLAIASLLVWASAWVATERNAAAETPSAKAIAVAQTIR